MYLNATVSNSSYIFAEGNNCCKLAVEQIIPKCYLEQKLQTGSGLQHHINLLQSLYDSGEESDWENAFKTDICLLPKIVLQIREKYPSINLIVLELGLEQLEFEVTKLVDNKIKTAKLIFGTNGLGMESNHFIMADYYLDDSADTNKISIIFFNAGSNNQSVEHLLTKSVSKDYFSSNLQIKSRFISLEIQKSNVDCLFFSLELAKAAHKSVLEMQKLHLLNINDELPTSSTCKRQLAVLATKKLTYDIDIHIPASMMKHCQSKTRIAAYINSNKVCDNDITTTVNKKRETLETRYKRFIKNKPISEKTAFSDGRVSRIYSIQAARLEALKKIERNWDKLESMNLLTNGSFYNSIS